MEILQDMPNKTFKSLDINQIHFLKNLVVQLSPSERYCFIFDISHYLEENNRFLQELEHNEFLELSLGLSLLESIHKSEFWDSKSGSRLRANYLSAGLRDALGIVKY